MRACLTTALLAAMLVATPSAFAQRASLADRVAALEQRAASDNGATELVNQISQLRAEAQELRGQIEQLQQQLEQARQGQRSQYLDLDGRLNRLEGGTGTRPVMPAAPTAAAPAPAQAPSPAADTGSSPVASVPVGTDERSAYTHAFDALKGGDYAESARRFRDFLGMFPSGGYAPNAMYWLGESYYVTQNYALASEQFQGLLDRYPRHDKAAGALLKLGLSQYGLKQYDAADATLRAVIQRFPGSDVARTADDRLRALELARAR